MTNKNFFKRTTATVTAALLLTVCSAAAAEPEARPASSVCTQMLVPGGQPFGIKLFTNGVIVVGTADLDTSAGTVNPPKNSDVRVGDVIQTIDGKPIASNEQVSQAILKCGGRSLNLGINRDGKQLLVKLVPVQSTGCYRAGLWVRDSAAGVGTLTFYDPKNGYFAGLGHGITDPNTNEIMPFGCGDMVPVTISGIQKGVQGTPGELQGYFSSDIPEGTLYTNCGQGVFGKMNHPLQGQAIPVCPTSEVKTGPVQIMCTIDDSGPRKYDAEIELLNTRVAQSRNMVLHITDKTLVSKTGGIVQGMSGSPILQNGKLVGAVTHVFVNDPTRGYGILAENMIASETHLIQKTAS